MAKQTDQKRREGKGSVYFPPSLKTWLEQHSKENGRSLSSEITWIIEQYAKEHGNEMPPEPPAEESTAEDVLKQMYELLKGMQGVKCIYV